MNCTCGHGQPHEVEAHGIELDPLPPRRRMIRATIAEEAALENIQPASLVAYLEAHGWSGARYRTPAACHYRHSTGVTALVPLARDFADYADRVGVTIRLIANVEGRSQLDVLVDLGGSIYAPAPGGGE